MLSLFRVRETCCWYPHQQRLQWDGSRCCLRLLFIEIMLPLQRIHVVGILLSVVRKVPCQQSHQCDNSLSLPCGVRRRSSVTGLFATILYLLCLSIPLSYDVNINLKNRVFCLCFSGLLSYFCYSLGFNIFADFKEVLCRGLLPCRPARFF